MSDKGLIDGQISPIHLGVLEADPFFHATSTAKQYRVARAAPAKRQQKAREELAKRESEYHWLAPHASAVFLTACWSFTGCNIAYWIGMLSPQLVMGLPVFLYGAFYYWDRRKRLMTMWEAQARLRTATVVRKAERQFTQNELCGYCERANQAARSVNQLIKEFNLYVAASRTKHTGVVTRADEDELRTWLTRMRDEVEEHLRSADVQVQIFDFKAWRQKTKIPEASFALEDLREAADRMRVLDDVDPAKALEGVDSVRKLDALEKELADRTGSVHAAITQARARTGQ